MTRKLVVLLGLLMASPLALTGCGTIAGVGQDISATGQAVQNVASGPPSAYYYCDTYTYDQWGNRRCYYR